MQKKETVQAVQTNEEKVILFLEKFSDSPVDIISSGTGVFKLQVHKVLKALKEKGKITANADVEPISYSLVGSSTKTAKATVPVKKEKAAASNTAEDEEPIVKSTGRDVSKYRFGTENYSKSRLVQAVIAKYVEQHPKVTLAKLQEVFQSDVLQKRYGTVVEISKAKKFSENGRDRHFVKLPSDRIKLADKKVVVVSSQWSAELLNPFLKIAKSLNFQIKRQS